MKTLRISIIITFSALIFLISCKNKNCCKVSEKQVDSLIKVDIEFSNMSVKDGNDKAFMHYAADSAILFRQGTYPIIGKDSLLASFLKQKSSKRTLRWKPFKADISISNDLGYTIGVWQLSIPNSSGKIDKYEGHYFTIWKKQKDGKWKFVVDGGTSMN